MAAPLASSSVHPSHPAETSRLPTCKKAVQQDEQGHGVAQRIVGWGEARTPTDVMMPAGMLGFTIRPFTTNLPVNPKTQLQAVCSIAMLGFAIRLLYPTYKNAISCRVKYISRNTCRRGCEAR